MLLALAPRPSCAQEVCRGDVNNDGQVTTADADALLPLLFQGADIDADVAARADANDDGALSAADVVAILQLDGLECMGTTATNTPTLQVPPSFTPTPTPTIPAPTSTPTRTRTPLPTPTPTQVCVIQPIQPGTTVGTLSTTDCQRSFRGQTRYTDAYTVTGTAGQAIRIDVAAGTPTPTTGPVGTPPPTPALVPNVLVVDPDGEFGSVL